MSYAQNTPIQYIPGIGWRTAKVMHDLGIHTAGQLNNMPERVLVELFGPSIKAVLLRLYGTEIRTGRKSFQTNQMESHGSTRNNEDEEHITVKTSFVKRLQLAAQFISVL